MYGTIARLQVKPDRMHEFLELDEFQEWPPGAVIEHVYQMDGNPNELYLVVMFHDKEAYLANAVSPEQHARYLGMRALLDADPEWHDGEVVSSRQS